VGEGVVSKFKVGDKVKRVSGADDIIFKMFLGDIRTVKAMRDDGMWKDWLVLEGSNDCWDPNNFELVEENVMKKSDLRTGMRVVHGKHSRHSGEYAVVVKDLNKIVFADGSYNYLSSYSDDLKMSGGVWDITEVYDDPDRDFLNHKVAGDLLWKHVEKTPEQLQLDKITAQIAELKDQADKLQSLMKNK
jgi:hypothetical protein